MPFVAHTLTLEGKKGPTPIAMGVDLPSPTPPGAGFTGIGMVLAHGAGGDMDSPHMRAYASRLAELGILVVTFTCRSPSLERRANVYQAVLDFANTWEITRGIRCWILGGHSMGGRAAVEVAFNYVTAGGAAAGTPPILGCTLFSYPLHPPEDVNELRDTPLINLTLPVMIIRGTRDPYSSEGQFRALLPRMTSKNLKVHMVKGGKHKLYAEEQQPKDRQEVEEALQAVASFCRDLAAAAAPL